MNRNNAGTIFAAMAAVVIPYLLTQSDIEIPPIVKVALTAANLALVVWSKLSGTTPIPVAEPGSPAQTPAGDAATVVPAADPPPVPKP